MMISYPCYYFQILWGLLKTVLSIYEYVLITGPFFSKISLDKNFRRQMSLSFCHSLGLICLNFTACGICGIRPTLDHQCVGLEERQGPGHCEGTFRQGKGHCEGTFRQGKGQEREGPWSSVFWIITNTNRSSYFGC